MALLSWRSSWRYKHHPAHVFKCLLAEPLQMLLCMHQGLAPTLLEPYPTLQPLTPPTPTPSHLQLPPHLSLQAYPANNMPSFDPSQHLTTPNLAPCASLMLLPDHLPSCQDGRNP